MGLGIGSPRFGKSYLMTLSSQGKINPQWAYASYLNPLFKDELHVGGYNASYLVNGTTAAGYGMHWYNVPSTVNLWQIPMFKFNYNSTLVSNTATTPLAYIVPKSQTIGLPDLIFVKFIAQLMASIRGLTCSATDGKGACVYSDLCSAMLPLNMPDMIFNFGDSWDYRIPFRSYVKDQPDMTCRIMIEKLSLPKA